MRSTFTLLLTVLFLASCGKTETRNYLSSGDYDAAIDVAIDRLSNNKTRKGKQDYIYMLEEAFAKAKERDLRDVDLLVKDNSPANLERIFATYQRLNARQEKIRPLLPLPLLKEKRDAIFPFDDYSEEIVNSKNALVKYLYTNAKALLASKSKVGGRRAAEDLQYLLQLSPAYKDAEKLLSDAILLGTDYVSIYTKNETGKIIPQRLETDILDFGTGGLNDKFTVYHSNRQPKIKYDYGIVLTFREINISPEQVRERQFVKEKDVNFGKKNVYDERGRVVKDSLGKNVTVDDIRKVNCSVYEFVQFKNVQVVAKVDFINFSTNQLVNSFPLGSEWIFENGYATYNGDRRAVENDYWPFFDRRVLPFPTNEQMVLNCSADIKQKLRAIIINNRFAIAPY
ncbi:hypothetical protein [Flavobacterium sp.]|uniref:hypothetical protein n=1 Tax=Flavobacterium sp. TaxID=239 RepID=UPI00260DCC85|nr:hypothetical protein [Flavobacterium sp.]